MCRYHPSSGVKPSGVGLGTIKSDDDQTDFDDLCCLVGCFRGRRGGNTRSRRLKAIRHPVRSIRRHPEPIRRKITVAPRLRRILIRWKTTRRRTRRVRWRCRRPVPVLSPDDPRYGRPMGAPVYSDRSAPVYSDRGAPAYSGRPVYSDRNVPTGPILSPDDPRYGRTDGPPPVIYSDRPRRRTPADLFGSRQLFGSQR